MKVEEVDGLGALGMLSIVNDDNVKVEEEDDFEVTIANKCTHACMCAHTHEKIVERVRAHTKSARMPHSLLFWEVLYARLLIKQSEANF